MEKLRIGFVVGNLDLGGAEKQLFLMARALQMVGVVPVVYSLTEGEPYEKKLKEHNIPVECFGKSANQITRLATIRKAIANFKPHIVQSGHFYTNIYAFIAAYSCGAIGIGAIRGDAYLDVEEVGLWGIPSLRLPQALIVNSRNAQQNLIHLGIRKEKVHLINNVTDLIEFDRMAAQLLPPIFKNSDCLAIAVAGLAPGKRLERFILALSAARKMEPSLNLKGVIVGKGPELKYLKQIAQQNNVYESTLKFLGQCENIPALLKQAQLLVLTSDHEGFPNVLLEAMSAELPIISTPVGDSTRIIEDSHTGFIVNFDDIHGLAEKMILLAKSSVLRQSMGEAGRKYVEQVYAFPSLNEHLLDAYSKICKYEHNQIASSVIEQIYRPQGNIGLEK